MPEPKNIVCTWCLDTGECTVWEMYSLSYLKENGLVPKARGRTSCQQVCTLCHSNLRPETSPNG